MLSSPEVMFQICYFPFQGLCLCHLSTPPAATFSLDFFLPLHPWATCFSSSSSCLPAACLVYIESFLPSKLSLYQLDKTWSSVQSPSQIWFSTFNYVLHFTRPYNRKWEPGIRNGSQGELWPSDPVWFSLVPITMRGDPRFCFAVGQMASWGRFFCLSMWTSASCLHLCLFYIA